MAVVLVFANPQRSIRKVQNILTVIHYLKLAKIPYFIHELAYIDDPYLFAPAENIKLSRSTSYIYDKDNLIQTLLPMIPVSYTKLCIMDGNIFFDVPKWYDMVSDSLESYDVCQPFTSVHLLGPDYRPAQKLTDPVDVSMNTSVRAFCRCCYEKSTATLADDTCIVLCDIPIYRYYDGDALLSLTLDLSDTRVRTDGLLEWIPRSRKKLNTAVLASWRNEDLVNETFAGTNKIGVPAPYDYPRVQDMAVVLPFFNPAQYNRIAQNIITVVHWLEQAQIPYYIAEMAYNDNPFLFKAGSHVIQYRSTDNIFYKENLVDVIESQLPPVYTKICMLDADILYNNPDWYARTSQLLDTCDVCQPFTTAIWTHVDFSEAIRRTHCLGSKLPIIDCIKEHQGFVWAFNREWYKTYPYRTIPICTSGGDTILHDLLKQRRLHLYRYYRKYYDYVEQNNITAKYAWLDAEIFHLNHGALEKRGYSIYMEDILSLIESLGVASIPEAVIKREDGILEWVPACKEKLNAYNDYYFYSRREDDV